MISGGKDCVVQAEPSIIGSFKMGKICTELITVRFMPVTNVSECNLSCSDVKKLEKCQGG